MSTHLPNDDWNWHSGHDWYGGWIDYICLLIPTVINNLVVFYIINSTPELNRSSSSLMVRILAVEDAAFSICCLIQCSINLSEMKISGERIGCEIQAFYCVFFMLSTGYTLCAIAYNSESKIAYNKGLTKKQVMLLHAFIWTVAAVIAAGASYMVSQARLMPSGLYCLVSLVDIESGLLFYVPGVLFIGTFLCNRYWRMYKHVTNAKVSVLPSGVGAGAAHNRQQQIKVAKRMAVIVAIFFVCMLPHVLLGLYELLANKSAPASAYIFTGNLIHANSLINPIIYVWMNPATRRVLWERIGWSTDGQDIKTTLQIAIDPTSGDQRIVPSQPSPAGAASPTHMYTRQGGNLEMDPVETAREDGELQLFQRLSAATRSAWIVNPDGTSTQVALPDDLNMPMGRFGPFHIATATPDYLTTESATSRLPVIKEVRAAPISTTRLDSPQSGTRDSQGLYMHVHNSSAAVTPGHSHHPSMTPG